MMMDSLSFSYTLLLGKKPKVVFERKKRFISLSILKIARRKREREWIIFPVLPFGKPGWANECEKFLLHILQKLGSSSGTSWKCWQKGWKRGGRLALTHERRGDGTWLLPLAGPSSWVQKHHPHRRKERKLEISEAMYGMGIAALLRKFENVKKMYIT